MSQHPAQVLNHRRIRGGGVSEGFGQGFELGEFLVEASGR